MKFDYKKFYTVNPDASKHSTEWSALFSLLFLSVGLIIIRVNAEDIWTTKLIISFSNFCVSIILAFYIYSTVQNNLGITPEIYDMPIFKRYAQNDIRYSPGVKHAVGAGLTLTLTQIGILIAFKHSYNEVGVTMSITAYVGILSVGLAVYCLDEFITGFQKVGIIFVYFGVTMVLISNLEEIGLLSILCGIMSLISLTYTNGFSRKCFLLSLDHNTTIFIILMTESITGILISFFIYIIGLSTFYPLQLYTLVYVSLGAILVSLGSYFLNKSIMTGQTAPSTILISNVCIIETCYLIFTRESEDNTFKAIAVFLSFLGSFIVVLGDFALIKLGLSDYVPKWKAATYRLAISKGSVTKNIYD